MLWFDGNEHSMCSEPLEDYFNLVGNRPKFAEMNTACWRGYVGKWEVRDDRLYLIGVEAYLTDGKEASLENIFPGFPERVFAHWYSGTVRIPEGKLLDYHHMGYESVYERDVFLEFQKGVLVSKTMRENGVAVDENAPEGYGVGAMTVFPPPVNADDE
jgi:hypothetical protein